MYISPVTMYVFGVIAIKHCQIQRHVDVSLCFLLRFLSFSSYLFVGWSFTFSGGIFVEARIRFLPFLVYWVCLLRNSVGFLSDGVSAAIETITWLLPCSLTMLFVCYTNLAFLEWIPLGRGGWWFLCLAWFMCLHLYSSETLVCGLLFSRDVWFWYESNSNYIAWVETCSFFYFSWFIWRSRLPDGHNHPCKPTPTFVL